MFMDEVDVNLNPKVGYRRMRGGEQAAVEGLDNLLGPRADEHQLATPS
jgi:hypothetical protein